MSCEANTVGASEIKSFGKFEKELKTVSKEDVKIERKWAMPSKDTFKIQVIRNFIYDGLTENGKINKNLVIIDPFAGEYSIAYGFENGETNDLNPKIKADWNMDAYEFLINQKNKIADVVLFDPPYSPRQIKEQYESVGLDTQSGKLTKATFYSNLKDEIARITKPGGKVFCCGWNSGGIGKSRGFELQKILIVAHGGWHNDTIVTYEKKAEKEAKKKWRE